MIGILDGKVHRKFLLIVQIIDLLGPKFTIKKEKSLYYKILFVIEG